MICRENLIFFCLQISNLHCKRFKEPGLYKTAWAFIYSLVLLLEFRAERQFSNSFLFFIACFSRKYLGNFFWSVAWTMEGLSNLPELTLEIVNWGAGHLRRGLTTIHCAAVWFSSSGLSGGSLGGLPSLDRVVRTSSALSGRRSQVTDFLREVVSSSSLATSASGANRLGVVRLGFGVDFGGRLVIDVRGTSYPKIWRTSRDSSLLLAGLLSLTWLLRMPLGGTRWWFAMSFLMTKAPGSSHPLTMGWFCHWTLAGCWDACGIGGYSW